MVYYKPVKFTINAPGLAKLIIDVVVWHHELLDSIVTNKSSVFNSKFWSSLCFFFSIKQFLSITFYLQTDGQTQWQNSIMETHMRAFVNFEQNNWARLLQMAEFTYNNAKNASTGHTHFELNCGYYLWMFYEENINPRSKFKSADRLLAELQELMTVCQENIYYTQELQKQAQNKGVNPRSYAPNDKVWLNSKYIKTNQNRKLKAKSFRPFWVLHLVGKQAYKFELLKKWRIHNVFHLSLLEQNTTRKERVEKVPELDAGNKNSKKYKVEAIWDFAVYANESESSHLPGFTIW